MPKELARWNKVKNTVVSGLANRRAAEAGLWARGSFVSSTTGEEIKEATAGVANALSSNTAKGAATVASISAVGTMLSEMEPVIRILGDMSPWVVGGIIFTALLGVLVWRSQKE